MPPPLHASGLLYALLMRPSAKAMEATKEIDKQIPAKQDVAIETPVGSPIS